MQDDRSQVPNAKQKKKTNASQLDPSSAKPRRPPNAFPLLTHDPAHRPGSPPLQAPFAARAGGEGGGESCDGADGAGLAELVDVGGVEGAGAVEAQGHGFDVDAQDPGRVGAGGADVGGGHDGGDGDVVLALYFVDGLRGVSRILFFFFLLESLDLVWGHTRVCR